MTVEVIEGQAYVTAAAGDAKLGKRALKAGERARLPESALLVLYAPKDKEEREETKEEREKVEEEEEQKEDDKEVEMKDVKEGEKEETEEEEKEEEEEDEMKEDEMEEKAKDEETDDKTKGEKEHVATLAVLVEDSDPRKMDNYLFYKGKLRSRPDRCFVGDFHRKWRHDFDRLEYEHGFIQWLFPLFLGLPDARTHHTTP